MWHTGEHFSREREKEDIMVSSSEPTTVRENEEIRDLRDLEVDGCPGPVAAGFFFAWHGEDDSAVRPERCRPSGKT